MPKNCNISKFFGALLQFFQTLNRRCIFGSLFWPFAGLSLIVSMDGSRSVFNDIIMKLFENSRFIVHRASYS